MIASVTKFHKHWIWLILQIVVWIYVWINILFLFLNNFQKITTPNFKMAALTEGNDSVQGQGDNSLSTLFFLQMMLFSSFILPSGILEIFGMRGSTTSLIYFIYQLDNLKKETKGECNRNWILSILYITCWEMFVWISISKIEYGCCIFFFQCLELK